MMWLYVFLQDFLIPFLCDPDLQCKPVARYTGSLYLRFLYWLRQRVESRVALSKPVARYTGSLPQDHVLAQTADRV